MVYWLKAMMVEIRYVIVVYCDLIVILTSSSDPLH